MPTRKKDIFITIRTEGAILPPDLLYRIAAGDRELDGLTPEDYHLAKNERLNEAINRSWNRLRGVWASFKAGLEKLPTGDPATTITRERWLLILFAELGYGRLLAARAACIEGKSYPVSHIWQHTPIHLVGCRVDLDRRTAGVAGAARMSPHSLVQELLNRSGGCLWGFVSNGFVFRILRDNVSLTRQSYVEFDLQAMMEGEIYADFALFWLLCHQSRVESELPAKCRLEKWSITAREQGTRVMEQLRKGVEDAITFLGRGFLAHPANRLLRKKLQMGDLHPQDYYRQLLRLVYRLIFLFVAEERGLLLNPKSSQIARERYRRFYSMGKIRRLAGRTRGTKHADLYLGLRVVMEKLGSNGGCPELGLPAFGSFLWSEQAVPELAGCDIANRDLLNAVRALSYTTDGYARRPVDYKNLGSEELGSVYESLLELYPVLDTGAGAFKLKTAGGSERKTTGSYYTPTSLINCLLDSALDPVLDEAFKQKDPEKAILNLKVCDPACGSGHFLIAAAHRIAGRLAAARTGDDEPAPEARRTALRDIIGRCIYGVDINEMAVELCKVGLWMEALEPGKPLSFLDHRILCGNSLLGVTPALLEKGIPDGAFKPLEGDDKKLCSEYKRRNRQERETAQIGLLFDDAGAAWPELEKFSEGLTGIDLINDGSLAGIRQKQEYYREYINSACYLHHRLLADTWCASFVWKKTKAFPYPITEEVFRKIKDYPAGIPGWLCGEIGRLANQYQLFHWHLAFPDVFHVPGKGKQPENEQTGWSGGFDVVLGNPPWERVKLQEKEWFAGKAPEIAAAPNAAARRRLIGALADEDPALYQAFLEDRRKAEGESHFIRNSIRYPLCGRGDINTYAVFAETMRLIVGQTGRVGGIVPSGIATDDTTKFFFQNLMDTRTLVSLYDFENREGIFPAVDSRMKFCLLTLTGAAPSLTRHQGSGPLATVGRGRAGGAEFVFFAHRPEDLLEPARRFTLSAEDLALLNPNTRTCPVFRSRRDTELAKAIYRRVPVLIKEGTPEKNPWGVKFIRMFDMSNDSPLFRTRRQLENEGWRLDGNVFKQGAEKYLPLYEAKMLHHYDHRFGTYEGVSADSLSTQLPTPEKSQYLNPSYFSFPRYWVPEKDVLLKVSPVPDTLKEAFASKDEDLCRQALYYWITGGRINDDQETYLSGKSFKSIQQLFDKDCPLTEDDRQIISRCSNCLEIAAEMIKKRAPGWLLGWRGITNVTNERTIIASILPLAGVGNSMPLMLVKSENISLAGLLVANLSSFVLDYVARFKVGGTNLNFFIISQLPVLPPSTYQQPTPWAPDESLCDWLFPRILELTYTARDLQPFAKDCGYQGPPFRWDEERRESVRGELDAAYFHLYGIEREEVDYIMETFPLVKRKDEAGYGSYRTKEKILEIYDKVKQAIETGRPYHTMLDPPPGPPAVWPLPPGQPWPGHIHPPRDEEKGEWFYRKINPS